MRRIAGKAVLVAALACASCSTASVVTPSMHELAPGAGEIACLVRGLGGPLTSYVGAGRETLEALGFRVVINDMTVSPKDLEPCGVVIAHSAGAVPALATTGPRLIFIIDGFASLLQHCPADAICTNFYNPGDLLSETLDGAENINCFVSCGALDKVPLLAHMTMPASPQVWRTISRQIAQHAVSSSRRTPDSAADSVTLKRRRIAERDQRPIARASNQGPDVIRVLSLPVRSFADAGCAP